MEQIARRGATRPSLDLQTHLARLDAAGLLLRIDRPINKDTELHPLVRCAFIGGTPEEERRAFLFTNVVDARGHRYEMPVVVGALAASPRIYAIGMGRPVEEIGEAWLDAIANPIEPTASSGPIPCQEVVITGDDLRGPHGGLARLPVPISTPGFDAAPYLTLTLCITRDPETLVQNMGTYRAQLKASDRLGVRMSTRIGGAGGYAHWLKYRERKEPMPCAIAIGAAPVVVYTGPQNLAAEQDEMAVAGALAGEPIRTAKARTIDLQVPAEAEIIVEGLIDPDLLEPEAPFGESHGHVALEEFNLSMQVTAITHRRNAVFASIISQVTPSESSVIKKVAYEPLSNIRPVIFLQLAGGTPRAEIWRALQGCASRFADCGKIVIAVSEDVDPSNTDAVFWSLAYRSNPSQDLHVQPYRSTGHGPKSGPRELDSTLLIDATMKHPMPPLALPAREFMERAAQIWRELGLGPLALRPPWHGYQLGDWSESWSEFAVNAVRGDWMKNGENTFARRRGGLSPETPVRLVETPAKPR